MLDMMSKESLFYKKFGVYSVHLKTHTLLGEHKTLRTYYTAEWYCEGASNPVERELTKKEYEFLLSELKKEAKTIDDD